MAAAVPVVRRRGHDRAAAAISLYAVAGIDSVVSWPSNQVLLSDPELVRIAMVLLAPTLVWLIVSAGMVYGRTQTWRLSQLPAGPRACIVAAAVVCAAVIFVGLVLGAAKGSVRILPGPRYQVSVIDNSQTGWTTVPLSQFRSGKLVSFAKTGSSCFSGFLSPQSSSPYSICAAKPHAPACSCC